MTDLATQLAEANERNRQLEALLGMAEPVPPGLGLTRQQSRMLCAILKRAVASYDVLAIASGGGATLNSITVQACALRRKLKPIGITIRSSYGEGYWMTDEDKARVRALSVSADAAVA